MEETTEQSPPVDPTQCTQVSLATEDSAVSRVKITVHVGEEGQAFVVTRDLATIASGYFSTMFRGDWKERRQGAVVLQDVEPGLFHFFAAWLETGFIKFAIAGPAKRPTRPTI